MYIVISRCNLVVSQWVLEVGRRSSVKIVVTQEIQKVRSHFYDFGITSFSVSLFNDLKIS